MGKTAQQLGIVEFCPEGVETIKKLSETFIQVIPEARQVVSGGLTQSEINEEMKLIGKDFSGLFVGLGCATGMDPIHFEVDESIQPMHQKRRPMPLRYVESTITKLG